MLGVTIRKLMKLLLSKKKRDCFKVLQGHIHTQASATMCAFETHKKKKKKILFNGKMFGFYVASVAVVPKIPIIFA